MVPRIVKQIVAVLIALAFIASLFFFIPKQSNTNDVTLFVLVPANLMQNPTAFNTYGTTNYSIIAEEPPVQIANLVASNVTTLLNLTTGVLKFSNISYSVQNGQLCLPASGLFKQNLCDSLNASWTIYQSSNGQNFTILNENLSNIKLGSLYYSQNYFILLYQYSAVTTTTAKAPLL